MPLQRHSKYLVLAVGALAGCVSIGEPPNVERINYQYSPGPFCGRCDSRQFTVTVDDRVWIEDGHWAGRYRDWRVKRRVVPLPRGAFGAFKAAITPYRPTATIERQTDGEQCAVFLTDGDEIQITWTSGASEVTRVFESGCRDRDKIAAYDAVREAVAALALPD